MFCMETVAAFDLSSDLSFQRGYCAFEFLRTYGRTPFMLTEHLDRLSASCTILGIPYPEGVEKRVLDAALEDVSIKVYVTPEERVIIKADPLVLPKKEAYEYGVSCCTTRHKRIFPVAKSTCYLSACVGLKEGRAFNPFEVIFLDDEGFVLEGGTSNIFGVKDGDLFTVDRGVLMGVTRNIVCEMFEGSISFAPFRLEELDECFLTSTSREILPITCVDGKPIGDGVVGPKTKDVMKRFSAFVEAFSKKDFV